MTTLGILGAGQLGRMLALAGYPLGLEFRFYDPAPGSPAGQLAPQDTAAYSNELALRRFAAGVDMVTYEFENVPSQTARFLADLAPVFPSPQALEVAQDRLAEKTLFQSLGISTPRFAPVDTLGDLQAALAHTGLPALLKTRRLGYDGKGQALLHSPEDAAAAFEQLGGAPGRRADLIVESFVAFDRELSMLAARGRDGACVFYPLVENRHREGILRLSLAPAAALDPRLQEAAEQCTGAILSELDYCGLLAVEFFACGAELLANEMAPRVHNSGHWTIDGAVTSQFANHLRAGLGWPLGSPAAVGFSAMHNLVGEVPPLETLLGIPQVRLHLYAKSPRPGRKLGHINLCAGTELERQAAMLRLAQALAQAGMPAPELEQAAQGQP